MIEQMLACHLREAAAAPFVYGTWDCGMAIARWVETRTGIDPAAGLGYRTELGIARLIQRAGGLVGLIGPRLEAAGLRPTDAPIVGDVGVVTAPASGMEFCAILAAPGRWVVKASGGVSAGPGTAVVKAWGF